MYRWHPKLADTDSEWPQAWGSCDKCGFVTNVAKMQWQFQYRGGPVPQNTRILTCGRPQCLDELQPQEAAWVLPPDPLPILNARPENYVVDETSWLTTDDGSIITTDTGDSFITSNPNPSTPAVANTDSTVEQSAVEIITDDGLVIITENGVPLRFEP